MESIPAIESLEDLTPKHKLLEEFSSRERRGEASFDPSQQPSEDFTNIHQVSAQNVESSPSSPPTVSLSPSKHKIKKNPKSRSSLHLSSPKSQSSSSPKSPHKSPSRKMPSSLQLQQSANYSDQEMSPSNAGKFHSPSEGGEGSVFVSPNANPSDDQPDVDLAEEVVNGVDTVAQSEESSGVSDVPAEEKETSTQTIEAYSRGGGQRRMTFRVQAVPDASDRKTDETQRELKTSCGEDVDQAECDDSDDDTYWSGPDLSVPLGEPRPNISDEEYRKEFEELLLAELDKANDESDKLLKYDDLESPTAADEMAPLADLKSASAMDTTSLRLWYVKLKNSYLKGVQVVKVGKDVKKRFKTIHLRDEKLVATNTNATCRREFHLTQICEVKMGYMGKELRQLLDITAVNSPFPPPTNCAVLTFPTRTLSLIFPSESARNEFIFLLRVEVSFAKKSYDATHTANVKEPVSRCPEAF